MTEPSLHRGAKVLYVPHQGHVHDQADREPLFNFHYDTPHDPARHGQPVELDVLREARPKMRPGGGPAGQVALYLGERDIRVTVGQPRKHWDAVVTGVWPDGSVSLDIQHPDPGQGTRHYDNVPVVSADLEPKPLHSCYVVSEPPKEEDAKLGVPANRAAL